MQLYKNTGPTAIYKDAIVPIIDFRIKKTFGKNYSLTLVNGHIQLCASKCGKIQNDFV